MYLLIIFSLKSLSFLVHLDPIYHKNPLPEQDHTISLLHIMIVKVTNKQNSFHKYAINQVTQCESEPQYIESTSVIASLYTKGRATTLSG